MENPFTITFGKQPDRLISRYEDTDRIISTFSADHAVSQAYLIEGIRGSGKTVLMTTVAKILADRKDWIVINLNPTMDLLSAFAIRLQEATDPKHELSSKGFSVSAAGFGIGLNAEEKSTDYVGMIDRCFKSVVKKKKRVLITIDEVVHSDNMRVFASQFQIFIRQDYPIFLIMTGLYENIDAIQNDPALTFLLRTPKITTGPLSVLQIAKQYREIFDIDESEANDLADLTKGYAFAFQALGVSYWNNRAGGMTAILDEYDGLLDDFVYRKIWSTLSRKEREILKAITEKEVKTSTICKKLSMTNSSFSRYREKLIRMGIMSSPAYGYVSLTLPRLFEVTGNYRI